jgi:thiol:disulfide interchange protein DsbD
MRRLLLAVGFLLAASSGQASDSPFGESQAGADAAPGPSPFQAQIVAAPATAQAAEPCTVVVRLRVPAGYYVYDAATTLEVVPARGVLLTGVDRPAAKVKLDPFLEEEVAVHEHDVDLTAHLRLGAGSEPVRLVVRTQGCSKRFCYFPQSDTLAVAIAVDGDAVVDGAVGAGGTATDAAPGDAGAGATAPPANADARLQAAASRGLFWLLVLAFGAGLATSLTPCVYPMIPITIGIIGARSAGRRSKGFTLSLLYVLGIAITYSALGTTAALTGSLFGSVLQNAWVVAAVAGIFVLMAMSLFGAFELQVPPALAGRMNRVQGSGYPGALVLGLVAGVVASPCIGPVLVAMLAYVAASGSALLGFGLFFTFALGLGVLFIVLGTFTGMLASLPRSGAWMTRVKIGFGILFLALAFYYLHPILPRATNAWMWGAGLVAAGLVAGAWRRIDEVEPGPVRWRKALARGLVVAGLYALVLPWLPGGTRDAVANPNWLASESEGRALAAREAKPMFVDFSADWCVACKELERFTFSDPRVIELSRQFVAVRVDATERTPEIDALMRQYGIRGLPWVAFVGPDGAVLPDLTVTGFIDADAMLERMQRAQAGVAPARAGMP